MLYFIMVYFKSWGIEWQIKWKNMGLWVRAHATVKNMGSMGDSDAEKVGLLSLTYASPSRMELPPPPGAQTCSILYSDAVYFKYK